MNSETKKKAFQPFFYFFTILGVGTAIYSSVSVINSNLTTAVHAQQDPFLDRRISQLEQRFSFVENRINRLEQSAVNQRITPNLSTGDDTETRLLRSQIDTLQLRLAEAECALIKLDERTFKGAARPTGKSVNVTAKDRCRVDANAPIQLSARP